MPALRRRALTLAGCVSLAAVLWVWLGRLDEVDWLMVEGPANAVVGEAVQLRVQVAQLASAAFLCADLHWARDRNTTQGFLVAGEHKVSAKTGCAFDFTIPVPAKDDLRFVNAIIYLSPDGSWSNHTFAATTDLIPVVFVHDGRSRTAIRLPLHQLVENVARVIQPGVPLLRWTTGLVWLFGAAMLGRRLWLGCRTMENAASLPRQWGVIVVGFALAGIWELAGLENTLGNWARSLARAEDVYYSRALFQRAVISVTVAAVIMGLGFGGRRRAFPLWLLGFGLYLAIAIVNLFSLHVIDQYASASWHGLALVDAAKCLCAVIALGSLSAQGRNRKLAANGSGAPGG